MKAPDFTLKDQDGTDRSLKDYAGKWCIVYFYPKDDTPGCTKEACSFRDSWTLFKELGVTVFGISADSVVSHKKFAEKYNLSFSLLSDPTLETIKAYDAWGHKKMFGKEFDGIIRKTFVISPDGSIVKEYPNVTPDKHAEEIIVDLKALQR